MAFQLSTAVTTITSVTCIRHLCQSASMSLLTPTQTAAAAVARTCPAPSPPSPLTLPSPPSDTSASQLPSLCLHQHRKQHQQWQECLHHRQLRQLHQTPLPVSLSQSASTNTDSSSGSAHTVAAAVTTITSATSVRHLWQAATVSLCPSAQTAAASVARPCPLPSPLSHLSPPSVTSGS